MFQRTERGIREAVQGYQDVSTALEELGERGSAALERINTPAPGAVSSGPGGDTPPASTLDRVNAPSANAVGGAQGTRDGDGTQVGLQRFEGSPRNDATVIAREVANLMQPGNEELLRRLDTLSRENRDLREEVTRLRRQQQTNRRDDGVDESVRINGLGLFR